MNVFVLYYIHVYGISGPSLLIIESTDSMITDNHDVNTIMNFLQNVHIHYCAESSMSYSCYIQHVVISMSINHGIICMSYNSTCSCRENLNSIISLASCMSLVQCTCADESNTNFEPAIAKATPLTAGRQQLLEHITKSMQWQCSNSARMLNLPDYWHDKEQTEP